MCQWIVLAKQTEGLIKLLCLKLPDLVHSPSTLEYKGY